MIALPEKPGWHWILKLGEGSVPEVVFWTGSSFLTINPTESSLKPEQIALCGVDRLEPPPDFFN